MIVFRLKPEKCSKFLLWIAVICSTGFANKLPLVQIQKPGLFDSEKPFAQSTEAPPSDSILGIYENGAVSSDGYPCSDIGVGILKLNGSAADAAIATLFCLEFSVTESMGIGGGFFLTYYDQATRTSYTLDAREAAPAAAYADMFGGDSHISAYGGLAVAVPGALRGYYEFYQRFGGKVSWSDIIEPTILLCEEGYPISPHFAKALRTKAQYILSEPSMSVFIDPSTNNVYQEGDILKRPDLAATFRVLQQEPDAIYTGSLAAGFLDDLASLGSIITKADMENYRPIWREPLTVSLSNGDYTLHTVPPPGSGVIVSFIMNILDNYNFTSDSISEANIGTTYQRIAEAYKYGYAKRTELGDQSFVDMTELIANLTSADYAQAIAEQITVDRTFQDPAYYGAVTYAPESKGTSHLAVLAPNGDAVSVTCTINLYFGAVVASASTGIVLNDEMDDFSSPNITNTYGLPPSPANFIEPGKRPVSSTCPIILTDSAGNVRLITGAAGGTHITSATAWQAMQYLWFGLDLKESVDSRRLHHQIYPMTLDYEEEFRMDIVDQLEAIGHNVTQYSKGESVVCSVSKESDGKIYANADFRKAPCVNGF